MPLSDELMFMVTSRLGCKTLAEELREIVDALAAENALPVDGGDGAMPRCPTEEQIVHSVIAVRDGARCVCDPRLHPRYGIHETIALRRQAFGQRVAGERGNDIPTSASASLQRLRMVGRIVIRNELELHRDQRHPRMARGSQRAP